MVELARERAPQAEFRQASFLDGRAAAVRGGHGDRRDLQLPVRRAQHAAAAIASCFAACTKRSTPGGLFVFDVATPGRVPRGHPPRLHRRRRLGLPVRSRGGPQAPDARAAHHHAFASTAGATSRDHEVHRLRLYDRAGSGRRCSAARLSRAHARTGYGEQRISRPATSGFVRPQERSEPAVLALRRYLPAMPR